MIPRIANVTVYSLVHGELETEMEITGTCREGMEREKTGWHLEKEKKKKTLILEIKLKKSDKFASFRFSENYRKCNFRF